MGGPGSGKKAGPGGPRDEAVSVRLNPEERKQLDALALGDELRPQTIRRIIRERFAYLANEVDDGKD